MDLGRYQKLKGRVDALRRDVDRAEGSLATQMDRLKSEFSCSTREEAETKLKGWEAELQEAQENFDKAVDGFEKKWGDKL